MTGIITNPIIIGIAAGLLWSALKLPMPVILHKAVSSIGGVATPMGLMAMGATFDIKKAFGKIKPTVIAAFIKLVGFVAVFMPLAVVIGFRREKLIAILVMLGSATTVSSYVMAKNMGHEGVVSSSVVMLTTMCSAVYVNGMAFHYEMFQSRCNSLRVSEKSLKSLTNGDSMAIIFSSLYVKALMKRSTRKFVHTRESDPSAERHLRNTRRRKVASEPDE
mgnify:CR=1 FL=1